MIYTENTKIERISLHNIGNKFADQGVIFSKKELFPNQETQENLIKYFLKPFKMDQSLKLFHESDINFNLVYVCVSNILKDPDSLLDNSTSLAKHLYERSDHPNIKGGEFYTVYFKNCVLNGDILDAVGLFKSENKDTFLKIQSDENSFEIKSDKGININKLDKGCLIFNTKQNDGYILGIVDSRNRGAETQYWIDDFLHVCERKDEYFNTQNFISLCKNFAKNELYQLSKADRVDFLNKSIQFFKENENFNLEQFANKVIEQPEIIKSFTQYKNSFEDNNEIEISDSFTISNSAVKKQVRSLKNVIKLDKNFDIHIHGSRELIEQGLDEKGKYYKVYYKEES
ncbi:nucleoid-associated protein [uncultured Dysgonomonas sp.]|uniref:nucleoid-associated protein n=1 Tax=uncultured Dysgonomonas sp. TaxID=206096 RepID=UPI0028054CD6|nr:nucleoid-associated protein [uncultured Dysgonomonas sp.]